MSALETLKALIRGERPASGLLHTARLDGFGGQAYGEEAILKCFQANQQRVSDDATIIVAPGHLALIDGNRVWIADLAGDVIARIWRFGPQSTNITPEPRLDVAFDPDLTQARGDVFMAASDHPGLASDAGSIVLQCAQAIVQQYPPGDTNSSRIRVFVIRAFGNRQRGAAVCAVYRLAGSDPLSSGFVLAAFYWAEDATHIIYDADSERAVTANTWTPSLSGFAHPNVLKEPA